MKFKWMMVVVVALLAMPAGAQAESTEGPRGPEQRHIMKLLLHKAISECKAEREASQASRPTEESTEGRETFRTCVKDKLRELKAALKAAVEQCKAEREADPVAFREKYGHGERNRRPFRRCVIQHVKEVSAI